MNELAALAFPPEAELSESDPNEPALSVDVQVTETVMEKLQRWADEQRTDNISEELDAGLLSTIGMTVIEEYRIDERSREEWFTEAKTARDLALQRSQPKSFPWPKASNVILPIMTEGADQFAARAYPAMVSDRGVVKGVSTGNDAGVPMIGHNGGPELDPETGGPKWKVPPGEVQRRADRIGDHMSWQLLEEQPEWEEDTDKMMHILPIVGCAFRKTYFDPDMGRNCSVFVSALDVAINYWAKSLATAPRISEILRLYPHEIEQYRRSGHFDQRFDMPPAADPNDNDAPHTFIEQHRRLDLDEDGYAEPYIVTVHLETMRVARITARYDMEGVHFTKDRETGDAIVARITPIAYYTKYDFLPNKEGAIYGQGFGQLLRPLNEAANTVLNQIIDAATLQTTGGGFVGKGLSLHTGTLRRKLGEWTVVNAAGGAIRDAVVPLQHNGPSPVLFEVLGFLVDQAKGVSSVKDILTGEIKAQTMSPTVFMSLVEQGLKAFTSIWKRLHRALKSELEKLYRLNRIYLQEQVSYRKGDQWKHITRADYAEGSGVEPMSDKNMVADIQKLSRAEFLDKLKDDPRVNGKEILRRMMEAASIPDIDKIIKQQEDANPILLMQIGELELKQMSARATAIREMATAVKTLAEADATIMEPFNNWMTMQLQFMQDRINALTADKAGNPAGSPGTDAGGVQPMEASPGNAGVAGMVAGMPGAGAGAAQPAVGGAPGAA